MLGTPKNFCTLLKNKNKEAKPCAIYHPKFMKTRKQEAKEEKQNQPKKTA